ncbi:hypothetical protein GGI21_002078, partial [Coemansia aciculifera]
MGRVCQDMYDVVQWTPQFSLVLTEMTAEYEEVTRGKHALYGDVIAQDGLAWRAMGLPVDSAQIVRVKQWLESVSELCLRRIVLAIERRAKSSSAYSDETLSADVMLQCSVQVLQSAALSATICGDSFFSLAPHVLYIAAECTVWTCAKFNDKEKEKLKQHNLSSRAMRLYSSCEGIQRILALVKSILVGDTALSVFDLDIRIDH